METKIQLSEDEWNLVMNASVLLTKNRAMQKISGFLAEIADTSTTIFSAESVPLPIAAEWKQPKISRGENYQGLPYLVLDYPRFFFRDDVFAIRTMFWWGNYFSVTLHLKGTFFRHFTKSIIHHYEALETAGFLVNNSDAEWNHAIGDEYALLSKYGKEKFAQKCNNDNLLKIAVRIPLQDLTKTGDLILDCYRQLLSSLKINSQVDGKGL
ncbi:MAG TPA: hypothetical protein VLC28_08700 [Flavitalea sp.]|nr:hypothetical protein [Flavitalea sp.]